MLEEESKVTQMREVIQKIRMLEDRPLGEMILGLQLNLPLQQIIGELQNLQLHQMDGTQM